jgi:hypothetical protein
MYCQLVASPFASANAVSAGRGVTPVNRTRSGSINTPRWSMKMNKWPAWRSERGASSSIPKRRASSDSS